MSFPKLLSRIKRHLSIMIGLEKPLRLNDSSTEKFVYTQEWYDKEYHIRRVGVEHRTFKDVRKQYELAGYHKRLKRVLDEVPVPDHPVKWLEVGCHLGLTACWVAEKYPKSTLYMFDFSQASINWCDAWFPYKNRAVIWQGSVENIRLPEDPLDETFDFATCIDVTEHLPNEVYRKLIHELYRVLKPNGYLILMQGIAPNVEHIHVLSEEQLVGDFCSEGFVLVKDLFELHHLLQKM
jgi:ubiquinone/menaquinone biosynthesis C-methylase UbiE